LEINRSLGFLPACVPALALLLLDAGVDKVQAIQSWPQPNSARALRGFLGLAGYYRRFIKNYGLLAAPLTNLLRKDSFQWSEAASSSFQSLKVALSSAPVLHLPDFSHPFVVD